MNLKLFIGIMLFIMLTGMFLALVYILNYALLQTENSLVAYLPASYIPVYQLANLIWTGMLFIGLIRILYISLTTEVDFT